VWRLRRSCLLVQEHGQRASLQLGAVEGLDGLLSSFGAGEADRPPALQHSTEAGVQGPNRWESTHVDSTLHSVRRQAMGADHARWFALRRCLCQCAVQGTPPDAQGTVPFLTFQQHLLPSSTARVQTARTMAMCTFRQQGNAGVTSQIGVGERRRGTIVNAAFHSRVVL